MTFVMCKIRHTLFYHTLYKCLAFVMSHTTKAGHDNDKGQIYVLHDLAFVMSHIAKAR